MEQRTWKPPRKPAFKVDIDAYQSSYKTFAIGVAVIGDSDFNWLLTITRKFVSLCMLEIQFTTLREILLQAWEYQMETLEIDLCKEVLEEIKARPSSYRSYLRGIILDILDLSLTWKVHLNYTQRPVNLVAAVLALLCQEQLDVLIIHVEPSASLCTALDLDRETFYSANQLDNNGNEPGITDTD